MPNVTSVWDFSPGETLTAAKLDDVNCGIHVFSGTATRDAAYGGSSERTLEEGEFCYLADSNTTQYYNGTSWVALGGGLTYLTGTTFVTATSFSLPNNTFSSTYTNYRILVNITAVSADSTFTVRMRASGTDDSSSNYQFALLGFDTGGTARNSSGITQTSISAGEQDTGTVRYYFTADIMNPQATAPTLFNMQYGFVDQGNTYTAARMGLGLFTATTSFDALSFISSTASSITGNYRVYGYATS